MNWGELPSVLFGPVWTGVCALGAWGTLQLGKAELATRKRRAASQDWPSTPGRVLGSKVVRYSHRVDAPEVTYEYTVDGHLHESKRLLFGNPPFVELGPSFQVVEEHPKGKEVTVFYDPSSPGESILVKGKPGGCWAPFACFLVLFPAVALCGAAGVMMTAQSVSKMLASR